jgi:hypothetical protein
MLRFIEGYTPKRIPEIDAWLDNVGLPASLGDVLPFWFKDLNHMAIDTPNRFLARNPRFGFCQEEIRKAFTDLAELNSFCCKQKFPCFKLLEVGSLQRAYELTEQDVRTLGVDLRVLKSLAKKAKTKQLN